MSGGGAVDVARRYTLEHPGTDFVIGRGDSMLPLYRDGDVLILARPPLSKLKRGETVVFVESDGVPVAHALIDRTSDGWITMGVGNRERDPEPLSDFSYIGVVIRAIRPLQSVILAYNPGKASLAATP